MTDLKKTQKKCNNVSHLGMKFKIAVIKYTIISEFTVSEILAIPRLKPKRIEDQQTHSKHYTENFSSRRHLFKCT